jgi:hypothetical protein
MSIPLISDLKDIVGTYTTEPEYKNLIKIDPYNYNETKLIKNTFSSLPISLIMKINDTYKKVPEIIEAYLKFINTKFKEQKYNFSYPKYDKIDPEYVFGLILNIPTEEEIIKYFEKEKKSNSNFPSFGKFKAKIKQIFVLNHSMYMYYIYNILEKCSDSIRDIFEDTENMESLLFEKNVGLYERFTNYNNKEFESNDTDLLDPLYRTIIEEENLYHTSQISDDLVFKHLDIILKQNGY